MITQRQENTKERREESVRDEAREERRRIEGGG
jgi:hypothetical protein